MRDAPGRIIVLNGAPRAGKSSIARVIQQTFDGVWMNLGIDKLMQATPDRFWPGIGLRPGGERPDLEPLVKVLYVAMYHSVAAHSRLGLNVVVDAAHHDDYSRSLNILPACADVVGGLPVLFVGVRCPIDVIMRRRMQTWGWGYEADGSIPPAILRWQDAVHNSGPYDLEVDTSLHSPADSAALIAERMEGGPTPTAFARLAARR